MTGRRLRANPDPSILDGIFAPYRGDAPGLAVGVALDGTPWYRDGLGLVTTGRPQRLSPATAMRIGSVSKHFLCQLLLQLAEEGRLALGDSPRRHLPELPAWAEGMTLRQLMSHTSGMRCSLDLILQLNGIGHAVTEQAQFELLCAQAALNFRPGSDWCYNNGGYLLLGRVAERAGGEPLAQALRRRLFEPAGMRDSLLRADDSDCPPHAASLHLPAPGGYARSVFGPSIGGEGGIVSTVDDMLRWMALAGAGPDPWAPLCRPLSAHGYGFGLYAGTYRGARIVHHAGNVVGGACQMIRLPDCGLDIIIITNRAGIDPGALALRVIDACVHGLDQPPADDDAAAPLTGDFHSVSSGAFIRLYAGDGRQHGLFHAARLPLRRAPGGALRLDHITSDLGIAPVTGGGSVTAVDLTEYGRSGRLQRLPAWRAPVPAALRGEYLCPGAGASARLTDQGGQGVLEMRGPYGGVRYLLEAVGPQLCLASTGDPLLPLGGLIEFDGLGFRFSTQRTRRLRFVRAP